MKKITVLAAVSLLSAAVFAEGLTVSGYARAGLNFDPDKKTFGSAVWMGGEYFGGASRIRLNADYEAEKGGVTFRYEKSGSFADTDGWFTGSNVKYLMAYADFFDGKFIAEGGKLKDRFTTTGGWEDSTFGVNLGAGTGVRAVFNPSEGLYFTASASDVLSKTYDAEDDEVKDGDVSAGDLKFDENLFGFTAKYQNDSFFAVLGAHLAGYYYGSVGITSVKDLSLVFEAFADDDSGDSGCTTILLTPWVEYCGVENLTLACFSEICITKQDDVYDETAVKINPAVKYCLNSSVALTAESSINIAERKYDVDLPDEDSSYAVITAGVVFTASEKASANVFVTIPTDTDYDKYSVGAGVKYQF